jgi:hypothetical protein
MDMKRLLAAVGIAVAFTCAGAFAQQAPSSSDAISKMLQPSAGPSPNAGVVGVVVSADGSNQKLAPTPGTINGVYAFVTVLFYADFDGLHATAQASSPAPTLYVLTGFQPDGHVFLVRTKVNPKDNNRSVKIGHAKFASYGGVRVPDPDWTIPYTAKEISPGEWALTPSEPLKAGEYGLFVPAGTPANGPNNSTGGALYGFSVATDSPPIAASMR